MAAKPKPKTKAEKDSEPKVYTRTLKPGTQIRYFDGATWQVSPPTTREFTAKGGITGSKFEFVATIQGRARSCEAALLDTFPADHEPKAYMRTFVNPTETGWVLNTAPEKYYVSMFGPLYELSGYLNASAPYRFAVSFFHAEGDPIEEYIAKAKTESRARMRLAVTCITELLNLNPE